MSSQSRRSNGSDRQRKKVQALGGTGRVGVPTLCAWPKVVSSISLWAAATVLAAELARLNGKPQRIHIRITQRGREELGLPFLQPVFLLLGEETIVYVDVMMS